MSELSKKMFIGSLTGLVNGSSHRNCVSLGNQNVLLNLLLLINILMNTVKNFITIHLLLNYIDMLEVVIPWMMYLIKYVFQVK